jgi:hypothetical protein
MPCRLTVAVLPWLPAMLGFPIAVPYVPGMT